MIVSFSGLDGTGKTTQIERLTKNFEKRLGRKPKVLWLRGGYTSGMRRLISAMRKTGGHSMPAAGEEKKRTEAFRKSWVRRTWIFLALLDLARLCVFLMRWWQWTGRHVVCDRYYWDTLVDFKFTFPNESINSWVAWRLLERYAVKPDVPVLLDVPVKESLRRAREKGDPYLNTLDILSKRHRMYLILSEKHNLRVIDGNRSIDEVEKDIVSLIM